MAFRLFQPSSGFHRRKVTAIFIATFFTLFDCLSNVRAEDIRHAFSSRAAAAPLFSAVSLEVPSHLGILKESFPPPQSSKIGTPQILLIEDAHRQLNAQKSIHAILKYLKKEYGVQTLLLEGGFSGPVPSDLLKFSDRDEINQTLARELLARAAIGGPEVFALEEGQEIYLRGIEDPKQYAGNLLAFRRVYGKSQEIDRFIETAKIKIQTLASRLANPELLGFLNQWLLFQDSPSGLLKHLDDLAKYADRVLQVDLVDPRNQLKYPELVRFFKLREIERTLSGQEQRSGLEFEIQILRTWLAQFPEWETERKAFEQIFSNAASGESQLAGRKFLENFIEKAQSRRFKFETYPHVTLLLAKTLLSQELDTHSLFEEIKMLENRLLKDLAQTDSDQKICGFYQDFLLLKKLLKLEISPEELGQVRQKKRGLTPSQYGNRLEEFQAPQAPALSSLDTAFEDALEFYRLAKAREESIVREIEKKVRQNPKDKIALVVGGFHTLGLRKGLRQKDISYGVITPRIWRKWTRPMLTCGK